MAFLGTYSYGLYVYHHFFSYYFSTHQTEMSLARALGSHTLAVAVQATVGSLLSVAVAFLSYQLFERRFLELKERLAGPRRAVISSPESPMDQQQPEALVETARS